MRGIICPHPQRRRIKTTVGPGPASKRATMILGVPLSEIAWLALAVVVAGVITGLLAGMFGIGGGAVIVPVLYEVFQLLAVPDAVRMQLCLGTSIAIILPTTVRSYLTHRAERSGGAAGDPAMGVTGRHRRCHRRNNRFLRAARGVQDRFRGDRELYCGQISVRRRPLEYR